MARSRFRVLNPQVLIKPLSYKRLRGFNSQTRYRYRKGLRGRWSEALVPIEGGREALEAIIGPLAAFKPVPLPRPVSAEVPGVGLGVVVSLGTAPPLITPNEPPAPPPPACLGAARAIPYDAGPPRHAGPATRSRSPAEGLG